MFMKELTELIKKGWTKKDFEDTFFIGKSFIDREDNIRRIEILRIWDDDSIDLLGSIMDNPKDETLLFVSDLNKETGNFFMNDQQFRFLATIFKDFNSNFKYFAHEKSN